MYSSRKDRATNRPAKPTCSVVTPTHNSSKFISKLLDSLVDVTGLEIILVDDHSSDFEQLKNVAKNHILSESIKILQNKGGRSAGTSRSLGLKAARGKWVIFADSDDYFSDDITDILNTYSKNKADVVLFRPKSISPKNLAPTSRIKYIQFCFDEYIQGKISKTTLSYRLTPVWSKLYKRSKINSIKFRSTSVANDVFWSAKAAFYTRKNITVDTTRHLYNVVERPGSITRTKSRNIKRTSRRIVERISADLWVKIMTLRHDKRNIHLGRHKSIFRKFYMKPSHRSSQSTQQEQA